VLTLEQARKRKALTQRDVAVLAGVSKTTILNIEKGQTPLLSIRRKIAQALGVPPDEIAWPDPVAANDQ